jgi:hypothetical protein
MRSLEWKSTGLLAYCQPRMAVENGWSVRHLKVTRITPCRVSSRQPTTLRSIASNSSSNSRSRSSSDEDKS